MRKKNPQISGFCCLTNVWWTFIEHSVETSLLMNIPTFWLKWTFFEVVFEVGLKSRSKRRMNFLWRRMPEHLHKEAETTQLLKYFLSSFLCTCWNLLWMHLPIVVNVNRSSIKQNARNNHILIDHILYP